MLTIELMLLSIFILLLDDMGIFNSGGFPSLIAIIIFLVAIIIRIFKTISNKTTS